MSKITFVIFLTAVSLFGMSFGTVLLFPKTYIEVGGSFSENNLMDTIPVEEEEPMEDEEQTDGLPLGVPAMDQGEIESVTCNNEDELDSYTIKYRDLSEDALEEYQVILAKAGFEIEDLLETNEGTTLKAQDGFVNIVVMFSEGSATINADLL